MLPGTYKTACRVPVACALLLNLVSCAGIAQETGRTSFQTNLPFDPRMHLETDICIVHRHGLPNIEDALRSWTDRGYDVQRMFFSGSDAGQIYVEGEWDGSKHRGEVETTADGALLGVGSMGRGYMVPTPGWTSYTRFLVRQSINGGALGVLPEEPLAHTAAGYSQAFKGIWEEHYGSPWVDPQSSVDAFFKASKLKSKLYYDLIETLLDETNRTAARYDREVEFVLPVHSPVSFAAGNMLFPHAAAWALPELDGFIGQVWTGPSRWTVSNSSYPVNSDTFFMSSYLLYSSFAMLARNTPDRVMYALADPVEDDPSHSWDEYARWYRETLTAMLLFPEMDHYEVMPWPDRVFLPGYNMADGTPGPQEYLIQLLSAFRMLQDMASYPAEVPEQRRIAILTSDTLGWQRGGPDGPSMNELLGLAFPLLERGVGVQVVPIERIGEPGYLDGLRVLLLSYDMWKPLDSRHHTALNGWIRSGGTLVFFGGSDAYNTVDEWWSQAGFAAPQDHLFEMLGVLPPGGRGTAHQTENEPALVERRQMRDLSNQGLRAVRLGELVGEDGGTIYVRFGDARPQDGWGVYLTRMKLMDGGSTLVEVTPNTPGERAVMEHDEGSQVREDVPARFADGGHYFMYRLTIPPNTSNPRLQVEVGNEFIVHVWTDPEGPSTSLAAEGPGPWPAVFDGLRIPQGSAITTYDPAGAAVIATLGGSAQPPGGEQAVVFEKDVGLGRFLFIGIEPNLFAEGSWGADTLRSLVSAAWTRTAGTSLEMRGLLEIQRGPYRVVRTISAPYELQGAYVDVLDPGLRVLTHPRVGPGEVAVLREITDLELSSGPRLLFGNVKVRNLLEEESRVALSASMPRDVRAVLRFSAPAGPPHRVTAARSTGPVDGVSHQYDEPSGTLLVECEEAYEGLDIEIVWSTGVDRLE